MSETTRLTWENSASAVIPLSMTARGRSRLGRLGVVPEPLGPEADGEPTQSTPHRRPLQRQVGEDATKRIDLDKAVAGGVGLMEPGHRRRPQQVVGDQLPAG